ncbi:MAG: hypothetical protein MUO67_15910 [Anaerolineales bacterium]|nr:hypothetical protein [Anaerolineales bacterium]
MKPIATPLSILSVFLLPCQGDCFKLDSGYEHNHFFFPIVFDYGLLLLVLFFANWPSGTCTSSSTGAGCSPTRGPVE